jgi:hypothetical protein
MPRSTLLALLLVACANSPPKPTTPAAPTEADVHQACDGAKSYGDFLACGDAQLAYRRATNTATGDTWRAETWRSWAMGAALRASTPDEACNVMLRLYRESPSPGEDLRGFEAADRQRCFEAHGIRPPEVAPWPKKKATPASAPTQAAPAPPDTTRPSAGPT